MKVLDIHVHVGKMEYVNPRVIDYFANLLGPGTIDMVLGMTPESLVSFLDLQEVHRAVLLAEYSPHTTGVIPNEFVSDFCKDTERLVAFGSIDLDSPLDAGSQTERCVKEMGCRGLKLLPSYSYFYPNDPRILPAYEAAGSLGVPVMFHTGTSLFPGSRIRYANPLLLDDVAEDFADLKIVMCDAGRPFWYKESEWMLRRHKNLYIDLSGIPIKQVPHIFPKLEKFRDRFIFGSDWPNLPSIADLVSAVKRFPYSEETIEAILWNNGARLIGLD